MIKRVFCVLAMAALLFVMPAHASTVLNFDDLTTPLSYDAGSPGIVSYGIVPVSYGGFNWGEALWEVMGNADVNKYPGNTLSFPSQFNAIYPGNGLTSVVSSTPFSFQGAFLGSWVGGNNAGSTLSVEGFLGGQSQGIITVALTSAMAWTPIDFATVDQLNFTSNGYYLLDNFTTSAPVPIPGAVWLLGSGLFGLVAIRRRMKN
jgi:hypothetical protein